MSTDYGTQTGRGVDISWPIAGSLGGIVGAFAFGLLLWGTQPDVIGGTIPALYGLQTTGMVGWLIHLVHGGILGLLFGAIISRPIIVGVLQMPVETDRPPEGSPLARFIAAGAAYGLAVWAILPVIVLPILTGAVGSETTDLFPRIAVESLLGHLVFGLVLGTVFALTTDWPETPPADTLAE